MSEHFVVVHDPQGRYWDGSIVDPEKARQLQIAGAVLLPVEPEMFALSSIASYSKRAWGAGVSLASSMPRLVAPLTIYVTTSLNRIHWVARLIPDVTKRVANYNGQLRLSHDSRQPGAMAGVLGRMIVAPMEITQLATPDEEGGWTIGGVHEVSPANDGFLGLSIYGAAPGLRLVWAAVTQARG